MHYTEQIRHPLWKTREQQIIARDRQRCASCGNERLLEGVVSLPAVHTQNGDNKVIYSFQDPDSPANLAVFPKYALESHPFWALVQFRREGDRQKKFVNPIGLAPRDGSAVYDISEILVERAKKLYPEISEMFPSLKEIDGLADFIKNIPPEERKQKITAIKVVIGSYVFAFKKLAKSLSLDAEKMKLRIDYNPAHPELLWHLLHGLLVRHKFFQPGKKLWEYPTEALETLCYLCHKDRHEGGTTPAYDEEMNSIGECHHCPQCHGAGWLPQYHYQDEGVCFRCRGARYQELMNSSVPPQFL